ncbi:MAG: S-adenosylmethionine decarboxylase [Candidatus Aenigmatarchaeota archaeon]
MRYGCELIVDCKNVPRDVCMDDERVCDILVSAAKLMGMKVITTSRYKCGSDSPPGIICFVMVDQSFLYCHSFANEGFMSIRVFTCGEADARKGWEFIRKELGLKDFKVRELELEYD